MTAVYLNTKHKLIAYRDFVIEEVKEGWEWSHQDYSAETFPVCGTCPNLFECVEQIDTWYERRDAA